LLDVLAKRISGGLVRGDCLVNGYPLPENFASETAYVQQLDTHNPESTVREALLFSARLRQPASVPMAEKEALYVFASLSMSILSLMPSCS
jgi:ATP-binding cassette, subfamily G (WHITE), member 2, SNQ2